MSKRLKIVVTFVVALSGIVFLATQSSGEVELYKHVEELYTRPMSAWDGKNVQVHGFVVSGSIEEKIQDQKTQRTFELESKGKTIRVTHAGVKPDTFKDQAETVVKGKIRLDEHGAPVLAAIEGEGGIMAKCPSKYDGSR